MPNNNLDFPAIMAVADRHASHSGLTDQQRSDALEAIAFLRASSSRFLDKAEQILGDHGETSNAELFAVASLGASVNTNAFTVIKALWELENEAFRRKQGDIDAMVRRSQSNGQ